MRLRTHLLQLLAPFHPGDEVVTGAHLVGVLLEIGLGWRFRTADGDVNVEVSLVADTERFAARTPRLALSYRALTHTPERSRAGKALCEALVPIVARNEDAVLAAIERETAAEDHELARRLARPRGAGRLGARARPRQPGAVLHDHAVRRVRHRLPLLLRAGADRPHATPRPRSRRAMGELRRRPSESARRPGARARGRTALADQVLSDSQRSVPGGGIALRGDALVSRGDPRGSRRARSSC